MPESTPTSTRAAAGSARAPAARASRVARRYGPWALVTGASDGIGRAFALRLAAHGLDLVLVARRGAALEALAAELEAAHGTRCRIVVADLSAPAAVARVMDATRDLDLGLLVAAAGFGTSGPLVHAPLQAELEMLQVNAAAVLALCWHCARRFADRGGGGIVLMSSLLAFHGVPRAAHYAATKAYVQTLAEGLRAELRPHAVDVIASAPGPVRSGFGARADMRLGVTVAADTVARVTLQALGRATTVRPGALSKLLGWSLALLPRWGQVMAITPVMKGITAHQPQSRPLHDRPAG